MALKQITMIGENGTFNFYANRLYGADFFRLRKAIRTALNGLGLKENEDFVFSLNPNEVLTLFVKDMRRFIKIAKIVLPIAQNF